MFASGGADDQQEAVIHGRALQLELNGDDDGYGWDIGNLAFKHRTCPTRTFGSNYVQKYMYIEVG